MTSTTRTGWPAGLLQDDERRLSRWLASQPDARRIAREVAEGIREQSRKSAEIARDAIAAAQARHRQVWGQGRSK